MVRGRKVSTKMLAEKIGVSASTASESIRKLAEQGLVDHEKYGAVTLTDRGGGRRWRWCAGTGCWRRSWSTSSATAGTRCTTRPRCSSTRCRIGWWPASTPSWAIPQRDPHGDPIPASDGQVPTPPARQLWACGDGDTGTVARISDADPEMLRYFDSVGINLDSRLRVLARREFAGMISVAIESADGDGSTVELGSPAAQAIWVVA